MESWYRSANSAAALDALPPQTSRAVRELAEYEWRSPEARAAYDAAIAATANPAERAYLARRRGTLAP